MIFFYIRGGGEREYLWKEIATTKLCFHPKSSPTSFPLLSLILDNIRHKGETGEIRSIDRRFGRGAAVRKQVVGVQVGPVENRLREGAMNLGEGGHEVLQGHQHLAKVGPLFAAVAEALGQQAAQRFGRIRAQLLHVRLEKAPPHHEQDLVLRNEINI